MERDRDDVDGESQSIDDFTTPGSGTSTAGGRSSATQPAATTDGFASTDAGVTPDGAYHDDSYLDAATPDGDVRTADDPGYATAGTTTDGGVDETSGHAGHMAEALGAGAGAVGGAAIGMAVGGPPGAVIGGLVGAAAGAIAGEAADDDDDKPGTPGHPEDDGTINDGSVRDLTY
ncbi:MAG: glycine zipper domain-containing protein [Chloroflexota bacterium]